MTKEKKRMREEKGGVLLSPIPTSNDLKETLDS